MTQRPQNEKPEILSVRTAARTRLFHIEAVELRFSNGNVREFERVAASAVPGAVIVVPVLDADNLLLVSEYAVGLERYELGLPMGRIQHPESALTTANRELMEETGDAARELRALHTLALALAPGILGYRMEVVLATGLYPCRRAGDEPEPSRSSRGLSTGLTSCRSVAKFLMPGRWQRCFCPPGAVIGSCHDPTTANPCAGSRTLAKRASTSGCVRQFAARSTSRRVRCADIGQIRVKVGINRNVCQDSNPAGGLTLAPVIGQYVTQEVLDGVFGAVGSLSTWPVQRSVKVKAVICCH